MLRIAGGTRPRPRQRHRRRGAGRLDAGRQDRRRPAPTPRPTRSTPTGLVVMPGGVDMHAHIAGPKVNLARKMLARGQAQADVVRRTPRHALRHHRQRAQHLRHRLPLRRHGLHHRVRRRHPAARRPPRPRGVPRHADHRQGLLRPVRQQPLPVFEQIPHDEPATPPRLRRLAPARDEGLRRQARQPRRRRDVEARRRQHPRARRRGPSTSRRGRSSRDAGAAKDLGLPHPVARPLQQPRPARQLEDDARHAWRRSRAAART